GKAIAALQGKVGIVMSLAFSADGKTLATGTAEGVVKLWDAATGQERATLPTLLRGERPSRVTCLLFSPDSKTLASAGATVKLWAVATGKQGVPLKGKATWITSLAFSPDGKLLAAGGQGRSINLWNVAAGEELAPFQGLRGEVQSLVFSPDG